MTENLAEQGIRKFIYGKCGKPSTLQLGLPNLTRTRIYD